MPKKFISLVGLLLCTAPLLRAQAVMDDGSSSWVVRTAKKVFHLLTDPNPKLDTTCIYQMPLPWTAGLETAHITSTADLHTDVTESPLPGTTDATSEYGMDFNLQNHFCHKVGASFGYGGLSAGYGIEVGARREERNTYFSLGLSGDAYGIQVQNYVISDYIEKTGGPYGRSAVSGYPGCLRDFAVDAYYVFNNRRFAYSAIYKGQKIQRRSVGSWMLSGRYLQGDLQVDDRDAEFLEITDGLSRYKTDQVSLGGGYSLNWVLLHRDPVEWATARGLRNLTLNLTALPMMSLYTDVDSYHNLAGRDPARTRNEGKLSIAFQAHAALGFCWDRYSVNVQAHYNRFGFYGASQNLWDRDRSLQYDINTRAFFQDLTAKVQFYVRF